MALETPSAIARRYTAVPMLPRIAMPSAPPNSEPVSEMADAAPGALGRRAADDDVGGQREDRRETERVDDERGHEDRQS